MADRSPPVTPPAEPRLNEFLTKWTARKIIVLTLSVLAVVFVFGLLLRFYAVIFSLFAGIVISIAIRPVTDWLHRRRLPLWLAVIAVYVVALLVLAGFVLLVAPLLAEQVSTIISNIPRYYDTLRDELTRSNIIVIRSLAYRTPSQLSLQPAPVAPDASPVAPPLDLPGVADGMTKAGFIVAAILALAYYWTLNGERTVRALLLRLPMESRDHARDLIATMQGKVGAFLRGQAILCLSVAVAMLVALLIIQLPYALSLALLAGIFEAIPILGPTLGAIPALLVALAVAPDKVVWVIVAVIIIQQLESNVLIPRVMDRSVGVNPVVTILSIIAFSTLLGLPGALLAIPLAAIIQVIISYVVFEPPAPMAQEEGRGRASVLRYEAQQLRQAVRKQVRRKEEVASGDTDRIEDLIESIASDVDSLLSQQGTAEAVERKS
jgi:predicted PurR-regulated permease PerM